MYYYGPMMNGNDWGWGIFTGIIWLIFFIFIVYVVIRLLKHHEIGTKRSTEPLDIVKERYAKGEISKEQFEQLKTDLK
jgi:putative membrane protein